MEEVVLICNSDKRYIEACIEDCNNNNGEIVINAKKADRFVFYCDLGMTLEMHKKIMVIMKSERYDIRWLSDEAWDKYAKGCKTPPKRHLKV